jgi:two-component system KDP operon response regulator KdpE
MVKQEKGTILVVDDDRSLLRALHVTLSGMGFKVIDATRGEEALSFLKLTQLDAVLLDIDIPGMGGVEACRSIRLAIPRLPILMLTAMDSEDLKVLAFDAGADDYITKPFRLRELAARLRSAVRRRNTQDTSPDSLIRYGQLELDPVKYRVLKRGNSIHLTPKEFDMLHYLMIHAGRAISQEELLKSVWGPQYGSEFEYLRTYMNQLRKKVEDDPHHPQYLLTVPKIGFRFNVQESGS